MSTGSPEKKRRPPAVPMLIIPKFCCAKDAPSTTLFWVCKGSWLVFGFLWSAACVPGHRGIFIGPGDGIIGPPARSDFRFLVCPRSVSGHLLMSARGAHFPTFLAHFRVWLGRSNYSGFSRRPVDIAIPSAFLVDLGRFLCTFRMEITQNRSDWALKSINHPGPRGDHHTA